MDGVKARREQQDKQATAAARAARPGRGLRKANTMHVYEGHAETGAGEYIVDPAETEEGQLVGQRLAVRWQGETFCGVVAEYDPFEAVHTVEYDDGDAFVHDLKQCKWSFAPDQPTAKDSPKRAAAAEAGGSVKKRATKAGGAAGAKTTDSNVRTLQAAKFTGGAMPVPSGGGPALARQRSIPAAEPAAAGGADVDPESGLAGKGAVFVDDAGEVYDVEIGLLDISQNSDKFYKLQVVRSSADPAAFWTVQRWGRAGTKGQAKVEGGLTQAAAVAALEAKFLEKTGLAYAERATTAAVAGKYKFKFTVADARRPEAVAARGGREIVERGGQVMWEYFVDNGVDGKANGWYDYFADAAGIVEGIHSEWEHNSWLEVRCVQSGYWSYRVDFNAMTQTNTSTRMTRPIRRVQK